MQGVALTPMAGAHGEFAGVAMIRAYHRARGDLERNEIIVPQAAHGTNPGHRHHVRLRGARDPGAMRTATSISKRSRPRSGRTPPASCSPTPPRSGCSSARSTEVARIVHEAGGLLYYDGANLNAILGKVRPGDMGFDVIHMNLHKTFSTPHGGGGPGSGRSASARGCCRSCRSRWSARTASASAGSPRATCRSRSAVCRRFMGNAGVLLRAYIYMRLLGREGMVRVGEFAALNANTCSSGCRQAGLRSGLPAAPRQPRVHHHAQAAGARRSR